MRAAFQRVGVVVDVGYGLSAELDDHVAAAQSGLIRRAAVAHARQLHARRLGGVIRDGAQVDAQPVAAALTGGTFHLRILRAIFAVRQIFHQRRGVRGDARHSPVVQGFGVVGRPVVVFVAAGEKTQHRHVLRIESRAVRGQIGVVLRDELEAGGHVVPLDETTPQIRRANGLHDEFVVAQTAHHVEVQIRHDFREGHRRIGNEPRRSHQTELFAGPERENDAPAARFRLREQLRQAQHDGRPRGVVVGAVVNLAPLVFVRERANGAPPDVIVMRPHQHVLRRRSGFPACRRRWRQQRHNIAIGLLNALDSHAHRGVDAQREGALEVRILLIEGGLHRPQALARRREQVVGDGEIHRHGNDAGTRHAVVEPHRRQRPGVGRVGARHHQDRLGAAFAGKQRLVAQAGVAVEFLTPLGGDALRHIAQHQRDFVRHVEIGERVVAFAERPGHGQSIAGEHHLARHLAVVAERQRTEVGFRLERKAGGERGLFRNRLHAGGEAERVEKAVARAKRRKAQRLQAPRDVVRRPLGARAAGETAFQLVAGQELDGCAQAVVGCVLGG